MVRETAMNLMSDLAKPPKYSPVNTDGDNTQLSIKIDEGKYAEVIYYYKSVGFGDPLENGDGQLNFNYVITQFPMEGLNEDKEFEEVVASILYDIVLTTVKNNENRTSDTETPVA